MVGAFDGEAMVGYFCVGPRSVGDWSHKIYMEGSVHPE